LVNLKKKELINYFKSYSSLGDGRFFCHPVLHSVGPDRHYFNLKRNNESQTLTVTWLENISIAVPSDQSS